MSFKNYLIQLENYLQQGVAPAANTMDAEAEALRPHFEKLKQLGTFKLCLPENQNATDDDAYTFLFNNSLIAQYSGALAFLQVQHRGAISRLNDINSVAAQKLLQAIITENLTVGVSVVNEHLVEIREDGENLILNGALPWVSGHTFFNNIVVFLNSGKHHYQLLLPFKNSKNTTGTIECSTPQETIVFKSINTVKVTLKNWHIPKNNILFCGKQKELHSMRVPSITHLFIGVSRALLNSLQGSRYLTEQKFKTQFLELKQQIDAYQQRVLTCQQSGDTLRAAGYFLAEKCATLARLAHSTLR